MTVKHLRSATRGRPAPDQLRRVSAKQPSLGPRPEVPLTADEWDGLGILHHGIPVNPAHGIPTPRCSCVAPHVLDAFCTRPQAFAAPPQRSRVSERLYQSLAGHSSRCPIV